MTPEELYAAVEADLASEPGVSVGAGAGRKGSFGSAGHQLKVDNRIFAMLTRGRLVVKLPRQRVEALVDERAGERFDPGHGRLMKEWLSVEPGLGERWLALAREALEFVRQVR